MFAVTGWHSECEASNRLWLFAGLWWLRRFALCRDATIGHGAFEISKSDVGC